MTDIFESDYDEVPEKKPGPKDKTSGEEGLILDHSVTKVITDLEHSKSSPELKKWMRGWMSQQAAGDDEADVAMRDRLKDMKDASVGDLIEAMSDVYLRKHADDPKLSGEMPSTRELTMTMLSTIMDYAGGDENPTMLGVGTALGELADSVNSSLKVDPIDGQDNPALERKAKEPLSDYLRRQKYFAVEQAKESHKLKFEECQTAIKDASDLWQDVESAQLTLSHLVENKHYDTFYFSPEGSLVTKGEAKDYHLNEEGSAALDQNIQQAEDEYYRLLDAWRDKSREVDKLTKEEYEAEDEIENTAMDYDRRIQQAEKEEAEKKKKPL